MKAKQKLELQQQSLTQLKTQLDTLATQLVVAKNEIKLGKQKNLKLAKNVRYQIALIKTYMSAKQELNQVEK